MYVDATPAIAETEPHTFSNPVYAQREFIYIVAHMLSMPVDPPSPTARTFDTYYDIEYINDNVVLVDISECS